MLWGASPPKSFANVREGLVKIKAGLGRGAFLASIPLLLGLILAVILFYGLFRYLHKWLKYGITALRVIIAVVGESRRNYYNELDNVIEFTGFTYDQKQDIFCSNMDAWQRSFGYCRIYDEALAPLGMIIDCEPIYFKYDGKSWLIELWKGQYDLTTGCEIGIYNTEGSDLTAPGVFNGTFYNSASNEDCLHMSLTLIKDGRTLFKRTGKHWWLTGFMLGEFSNPSALTMKVCIVFKDSAMRNEFVKGLKNAGYSREEIAGFANIVCFKFGKPKTSQPVTRTKITDWIIQKKNKFMCTRYKYITEPLLNMRDKLNVIEKKAPRMYGSIINIGRTKKLFSIANSIRKFMDGENSKTK